MTDLIELTHPFKDLLPDVDEFFLTKGGTPIQTINSLCDRIKDGAETYKTRIKENEFKGGMWELFSEYLVKTNASDNRIGIYNYRVILGDDDTGVDGAGLGENQHPATVQCKFRNGDYTLTNNADMLSNFLGSSVFDFGVHTEDDKNMLLITSGKEVCPITLDKMLKNKVRVLARTELRQMFDVRPEWWLRFYESVKKSRTQKTTPTPPKTLRPHQIKAVELAMTWEEPKGKIIAPTGTGKTLVEAEIIRRTILKLQAAGAHSPIVKVNSSRILLCFQLYREISAHLVACGINAKYVNFNSGCQNDADVVENILKNGGTPHGLVSSTKPEEVQQACKDASLNQIPLIVFSTYHSSRRYADSGLVPDLTIHDEAHNLVSKDFYEAAILSSHKDIYLTATEKVTDSEKEWGMNNEEIFGKMIYSVSPKEMIDAGEMVKPLMQVVRPKDGHSYDLSKIEGDYEAVAKSIIVGFDDHNARVKSSSAEPDGIGAKMLVVCRGQLDLLDWQKHGMFELQKKMRPDIKTYALSSDFGLWMDGEYIPPPVSNNKKQKLLDAVRNLPSTATAIIYHVDIIGEGIDVPGLTGVMPFRNSEMCKFYQNCGRASRLHPIDRERLYRGEISTADISKWIKPFSWIVIPAFLENSEGFADRYAKMIKELRDKFGFIPQQDIRYPTDVASPNGVSDEKVIDPVNDPLKNHPSSHSGLSEFKSDFEPTGLIEKLVHDDAVAQAKEKYAKIVEALFKKHLTTA